MQEDVFSLSRAISPILRYGSYKRAHQTLKDVMKRKKDSHKDLSYYASRIAQSHPGVDVKKLIRMYKEEQEFVSKAGAGEDGRPETVARYIKDTPGQKLKRFKDYTK